MSTIHLHRTTAVTAKQYIAALTNFGPGRSKLFGNSADEYLQVHQRGLSEADVTEGSGGVWERLHYDWSDPPTSGAAHRGTLTPSRAAQTAILTLMLLSYGTART